MSDNKPQPSSLDDQAPEPASASQKKTLKIVLIILAVLVVMGVIGSIAMTYIGLSVGEKIVEEATNTEIDRSKDGLKIESRDGNDSVQVESGSDVDMPNDLPEVPLYESSSLIASSSYTAGDQKTWTLSFTTESTLDEVYGFYDTELSTINWEQRNTTNTSDMRLVMAENPANETQLQVSIHKDGDGEVSINLTAVQ